MKKILLVLVAGMFILALPVIACAGMGTPPVYGNFSGFCAKITARGFKLYSTSAGPNAGMKQFSWTEKADKTLTGPKNLMGSFSPYSMLSLNVLVNADTCMQISGNNPIAPKNGNTIIFNANFLVGHITGGDITFTGGGITSPVASGASLNGISGTSGTLDQIIGSATAVVQRNPKTGAMVMILKNISCCSAVSYTVLYSNFIEYWNVSPNPNVYNWVVTSITVPPITLTPGAYVAQGAWWE